MEQEKDIHVVDKDEKDTSKIDEVIHEDEDEVEVIDETEETEETEETVEEVNPLQSELEKVMNENEQLKDKLLRAQAEFENYKKRTEKEKIAARKYKSQDLATELLPVLDNFERALQTEVPKEMEGFYNGVKMVYEQLQQALTTQEITPMEVVNQEFNPNLHHAVMQVEDEDQPSNTVIEELQKGYMIKDRVIRPAMVKVNK